MRATLEKNGTRKALIVDGGGFRRCALLGDDITDLAYQNHWIGIIVFGSIRDSVAVSNIDIGILALGTHPKKSTKNKAGMVDITVHFAGLDFIPEGFIYVNEDELVVSHKELK